MKQPNIDTNAIVSIIMPTYNSASFIEKTIQSIIAQSYPHWELWIVDDGSTDQTATLVSTYLNDSRIHLELRPHCGSPAQLRNWAIRAVKTDYLALIDSDDLWHPDKLYFQMKTSVLYPEVALIYTAHSDFSTTFPNMPPITENQYRIKYHKDAFMYVSRKNLICLSSVLIKKSQLPFEFIFPESRQLIIVEDYYMWLSASAQSSLIKVLMPLVYYRVHENNLSKNHHQHVIALRSLYARIRHLTTNQRIINNLKFQSLKTEALWLAREKKQFLRSIHKIRLAIHVKPNALGLIVFAFILWRWLSHRGKTTCV